MKILIRNSDSVVLFAGADLVLTADGLTGDGFRADFCTSANSTLVDVAALPAYWGGGMYSYISGVWTVVNQAAYDDAVHKASLDSISKFGNQFSGLIDRRARALEAEGKTLEALILRTENHV